MIPLLSGIIDTPKCPFFYQNDSFVVPGRDVSMRTNVSIAPWHHLGQIHEAEPYHKQADTHKPTQESFISQDQKGKSGLWFLAHFQKDNIRIKEKVSETLFYILLKLLFSRLFRYLVYFYYQVNILFFVMIK